MRWFIKFILQAIVIMFVAQVVDGISIGSVKTAFIASLVLSIINLFIRPIVVFFTLPLNFITLGLFSFVINALMFYLTSVFIQDFTITGFVPAFLGALILTFISWGMDKLAEKK